MASPHRPRGLPQLPEALNADANGAGGLPSDAVQFIAYDPSGVGGTPDTERGWRVKNLSDYVGGHASGIEYILDGSFPVSLGDAFDDSIKPAWSPTAFGGGPTDLLDFSDPKAPTFLQRGLYTVAIRLATTTTPALPASQYGVYGYLGGNRDNPVYGLAQTFITSVFAAAEGVSSVHVEVSGTFDVGDTVEAYAFNGDTSPITITGGFLIVLRHGDFVGNALGALT